MFRVVFLVLFYSLFSRAIWSRILLLDSDSGRMVSSRQVQIVQAPVHGFLYPAFNDRDTDLHSMLYFTKKPEDSHPELIEKLLGIPAPTSSVDQQHIFESIIAEVTDDKADFEVIKTLHENLKEILEFYSPTPPIIAEKQERLSGCH